MINKTLKIIIALSFPALTFTLSTRFINDINITISCILSFIISSIFVYKFLKIDIKKINYKILFFSCLISLFSLSIWRGYYLANLDFLINIFRNFKTINNVLILNIVMAVPSLTLLYYLFYNFLFNNVKIIFKKASKREKIFFGIVLLFFSIITTQLYTKTSIFDDPRFRLNKKYDVIFTTDTAYLREGIYENINHPENDIRQPLYGVVSIPFSMPVVCIAKTFGFSETFISIAMCIIQFILILISIFLISKLLELKRNENIIFYFFILSTFTYILFSLVLEQYIISMFYLILYIYKVCEYKKNNREPNLYLIPAVGSLLTTGILFPFASNFNKRWLLNILKCAIVGISLIIVFGQLEQIIYFFDKLNLLLNYFGGKDISFIEKVFQFTNFVKSLFFAPDTFINYTKGYPQYLLNEATNINVIGISIIIICFISYYLNENKKIAKLSFFFIIYSFIILFVLGWGTQENGLILYSLYFGWAYIVLIFMFIKKVLKKHYLKIIIPLIILMMYINYNELFNIIIFGIENYRR